jgi:uncharacterized DUF497 family protein
LFEEAIRLFDQPFLRIRSDRSGEIRWTALGNAQGGVIAVIYTERHGRRKYEREIYKDRIGVTS